ncbi:MAG: hypothetical protein N2C14_17600, partial [Planctomycetales bacterium]
MNLATIAVLTTLIGVDYGYQPADGGGLEYLIQIEPELLDSLQAGELIEVIAASHVPPGLTAIRRFRVTVGDRALPKIPETVTVPALKPAIGEDEPLRSTTRRPVQPPIAVQSQEGSETAKNDVVANRPLLPDDSANSSSTSFALALMALFTSLGANAFLGWVVLGQRRRASETMASSDSSIDAESDADYDYAQEADAVGPVERYEEELTNHREEADV